MERKTNGWQWVLGSAEEADAERQFSDEFHSEGFKSPFHLHPTMGIPSFVIGIAGGTGAGKTTVAREITETRSDSITRIPMDNYYKDLSHLDFEERTEINYDHPSAFEWDLLRDHLDSLLSGQPIQMPQYDFNVHNRKDERVTVEPTDVVVLEGILALYDSEVNEMLDLQVYVETDADVRILRRIERDVVDRGRDLEGVMDQYLSTVKPMHEQFVEPTKKHADLIIPEGANRVAVNLLEEKVRAETRTEHSWDVEEEIRIPADEGTERKEAPAPTPNGGGERWSSEKSE